MDMYVSVRVCVRHTHRCKWTEKKQKEENRYWEMRHIERNTFVKGQGREVRQQIFEKGTGNLCPHYKKSYANIIFL